MSDSQVGYAPDWYRKMQRDQERQQKMQRNLAESRVHAIIQDAPAAAEGLLYHLISLDPVQALEMLVSGGYKVLDEEGACLGGSGS